jgi:hypothetical protein
MQADALVELVPSAARRHIMPDLTRHMRQMKTFSGHHADLYARCCRMAGGHSVSTLMWR